jgi:hypothetical protein
MKERKRTFASVENEVKLLDFKELAIFSSAVNAKSLINRRPTIPSLGVLPHRPADETFCNEMALDECGCFVIYARQS